jgi:hypothetical protein
VSRDPFTVKAIRIGAQRDGEKTGVVRYSPEPARAPADHSSKRVPLPVIDAHHHLWTADYPWLASQPEIAPIRPANGIRSNTS